MRAQISIIAMACVLGGCIGPLVPVSHVDDSTSTELSQTIRTFPARDTPTTATMLGAVTATSCKNKMWDKDASEEDAINQLRLFARGRGGNAVGNLVCEVPQGTSLATNCWASITCTGTAIKLAEAQHGPQRSSR